MSDCETVSLVSGAAGNARCGAHVSESTKKTIVILSYATDTDRLTARR